MKIKDGLHDAYGDYVKLNSQDDYSRCVVDFAAAWADAMEERIAKGDKLEDIAGSTSHEVDQRPGFGITGAMYGFAVHSLAKFWEHGEELRRWHNKDYGQPEAKGTVNPAVLIIDAPEAG